MNSAFLIVFGTALLTGTLLANGGGYSSGVKSMGAFQPIGVDQVQMVSEDLEIDLRIEYAIVRIQYVLHNPGKKIKVAAGFPSAVMSGPRWEKQPPAGEAVRAELSDFLLEADGRKVDFRVESEAMELRPSMISGSEIKAWHVVDLRFDAGQTRRISVVYRQRYHRSMFAVSGNGSESPLTLTYLFSAAGLWVGAIERGTVVVRAVTANPKEVTFSHPKRFQREGDAWVWNFRDLEPTLEDDLVITVRSGYEIHSSEDSPTYFAYGSSKAPQRWEVHRRPDAIAASSFLTEPDTGATHPPDHLTDSDRNTVWSEGVPGDGIGESVTLKLKKPVNISRVGLANGHTKSAALYAANNRVAELLVRVNGGNPFSVKVPDEYLRHEYFFFDLPGNPSVETLELAIFKVYEGSSYEDTCLSDITLVVPVKKPKLHPVR